MRRTTITFLTLLAVASITICVALAQNAHYKRGPACSDQGVTARCTGTLAGLGNYDIKVELNTTGTGKTQCTNPGNGNVVPGQNPSLDVNPSSILFIPTNSIKNGTATFDIRTVAPTVTSEDAGCPNDNWDASFTDVIFTGGTLVVSQCIGGTLNTTTGACSGGTWTVVVTTNNVFP